MSIMAADCPRCGIKKMTFRVGGRNYLGQNINSQTRYEVFAICNDCNNATTFIITSRHSNKNSTAENRLDSGGDASINIFFNIEGFVNLRHNATQRPPESIPPNIKKVFEEGATCLSTECWNATGAMFRTCLDLASKDKIPREDIKGLTKHHRENMGARIGWLFDNGILPENLRELADCVRHDGNDGAHDATLTENEAIDLLEFTTQILEYFYTQPAKAKESKERRAKRNANPAEPAQPPES